MKFIVLLLAILFAFINARVETETGTEMMFNMCGNGKTPTRCNAIRICSWDVKLNACKVNFNKKN